MPRRTDFATNLSSLLRRCAAISSLQTGQQAHARSLALGLHSDATLQTDLLLVYSRCFRLDLARKLFDRMPQRTMHSWNILLSSYTQSSLFLHALFLFPSLLHSGLLPDHFTLPSLVKSCASLRNLPLGSTLHSFSIKLGLDAHVIVNSSIVDMYAKLGCFDDAHKLFETMSERDSVVWNSLITGLARAGLPDEALCLFRRSQWEDGGVMDSMVVPSVLSACGQRGELRRGKEVHGRVLRFLMFCYDVAVSNSLIDMYGKCGCLDDSLKVFSMMGERNVITWSSLIACYGVHGKGSEALRLYNEMIEQGFKPNCVMFTSILSSCSHSGMVEEGRRLFGSMRRVHGVEPGVEHYACMVDLLGRAGNVEEGLRLIEDMPIEPAASVWGALLGACVVHRNVKVGEIAAVKLFELEAENTSNYVALCGVYETVGLWDGVAKMRARMRELGMVKTPGCSWVDVKGRLHAFHQGDVCFPSSKRTRQVLDWLSKAMALGSSWEDSVYEA